MASVHNSIIGTLEKGAALTTENNPTAKGFVGLWEDVKDYTSVVTTYNIVTEQSVSLYIQWTNTNNDIPPNVNPKIIATDTFSVLVPDSIQVQTKARWARIVCEKTAGADTFHVKITTIYKKAPTEISLTENNTSIVSLNKGDSHTSIKTVLTDFEGVSIGNSNNTDNAALYISLTDNTISTTTDRIATPNGASVALSANGNYGTLVPLTCTEYEFAENSTIEVFDRTTINSSNNTINLPKKYATFSHGDIVNFFVYYYDIYTHPDSAAYKKPTQLTDAVSVSNIAKDEGKIIAQARVNVINTDATHITFQLLVDVDTSKWFDPDSNAYLFDAYKLNRLTYIGLSMFDYYTHFKNSLQNGAKLLYPGQYPLDMKLYIGSLYNPAYDITETYSMAAFQLVSTVDILNILNTGLHLSSSPVVQLDTASYSYNPAAFTQLKLNIMIDCHDTPNLNAAPSASLFNNAQLTTVINTLCNAFPNALQTKTGKNFLPTPNGGNYIIKAQVLTNETGDSTSTATTLQLNKIGNNFSNPDIPAIDRLFSFQPGRWLMHNTNATLTLQSYKTVIYPTIQMLDDTDTIIIVIGSKLENISDEFFNFDTYPHIKMLYNLFKHIKIIVAAPYTAGVNDMESHQLRTLTNFAGSKDNIIWYTDYNELISPSFLQKLANRAIATSSAPIKNPLISHTANSAGISQAATTYINTDNSGVAMYYTITDSVANTLDSTRNSNTNTTGLNAMHVSLAVPNLTNNEVTGFSRLSGKNPLYVSVSTIHTPIYPLDAVITQASIGAPVFLTESNDPLIQINLNAIGFVNESPIPVWLRLYNITQQGIIDLKDNIRGTLVWNNVPDKEQKLQNRLAGYDNDGNNYNAANDKLKLNIAVSPLSTRDLDLSIPIRFPNGIHVSASSNNNYTSIDDVGDNDVFLHGSWVTVAA